MPHETPPRPRCAFRVAAIGHRWDRLAIRDEGIVRNQFRSILGEIAAIVDEVAAAPEAGFAPSQVPLTLFSALAEGTDRLAAEAVLQTGDRW